MDNYNIDGYMRLGEAVIMQAARDYMKALRQLNKHQRDSAAKYTVKECESFFRNRMGKYVVSDIVLSGKLNDAQSSALIRTVFTPAGCSGHFIQYRFGSLF